LLADLYKTREDAGLLSIPIVLDTSNMTTADLIGLLLTEVRNTKGLVANSTILQIRAQQNTIRRNNEEMMKKLTSAAEAAQKAEELKKGLGIFKWVMLAVSFILTVVSTIATVVTFGGATPLLVVSATFLAISIALTIAGSVPVDDKQNTAMDLASQKMAASIAELAKQNMIADLKKDNKDWDKMNDAQQQEIINKAQETGQYSAMGIMISIQVILAVVMICASAGACSGTGASQIANAAGNASQSAARTALESARNAIANNMTTIMQLVKASAGGVQLVKNSGQIAQGGVTIDAALTAQEAAEAEAEAKLAKALAALLDVNNEQLLEIVSALLADIHRSYEDVATLLHQDHQTLLNIHSLSGTA
jgi:hypothetical protein